MFVLFSPSEGKRSGGLESFGATRHELIVSQEVTADLIAAYEKTLQSASLEQKVAMTGWKKEEMIESLPKVLDAAPVLPAFKRYTGVGYQYLDVDTLTANAYAYLESHVFIFSHLFGPLRGSDRIPETKLKQCRTFGGMNIPTLFRQRSSQALQTLIGEGLVLDLRAAFYKDFFTPNGPTIECIFLQNGKSVSHWSKAYRGQLLRMVAEHQPKDLEALRAIDKPGWTLVSSEEQEGKWILTFDVQSGKE